jgi:hypothetical protein
LDVIEETVVSNKVIMFINTPALSKLIYFEEIKVRRPENMAVSGSGMCEGSVNIFGLFLVTLAPVPHQSAD